MILQLDLIKEHLLIDPECHEDDRYLLDLATVVETAVLIHADVNEGDILDCSGNPCPVYVQLCLLLLGTLYNNRESVSYASAVKVPHTYDYLMALIRNYNYETRRL